MEDRVGVSLRKVDVAVLVVVRVVVTCFGTRRDRSVPKNTIAELF